MKMGPRYNKEGVRKRRINAPVKISSCTLMHSDECLPGTDYQALAKKSEGAYAINPVAMLEVLKVMSCGPIHNTTLRHWLREVGHIPLTVGISSSDLYNFRKRAILFTQRENKSMTWQEAKALVMCKSLDNHEECMFGLIDNIGSICQKVFEEVMKEPSNGYDLEVYLRDLKQCTKGFDYSVAKDKFGQTTGVTWMTPAMRKSWLRYGDIMFLDAKLKKMNVLSWPYIGPCGIDNENRVCLFCESLVVTESFDAYTFVLNSLFGFEPARSKKSIKVIYGDCIFNDSLLISLGLEAQLFYDHYHLLNRIWPENLGDNIFLHVQDDLIDLLNSETEEKYHQSFEKSE